MWETDILIGPGPFEGRMALIQVLLSYRWTKCGCKLTKDTGVFSQTTEVRGGLFPTVECILRLIRVPW